jgi:catechol 2,3-dioxygenase-like lactoylglutathione lyase family enzyme
MDSVETISTGTCCDSGGGGSVQALRDIASAVEFKNERRPHLSINVKSLKASVPFYTALFGSRPTKLRSDYAKWETENPPVNLSLNEHPEAVSRNGHFGIEVKSTDAVQEYFHRLRKVKVEIEATEKNVACCYSVQTKIWATDPDSNHWEVFVVTEKEASEGCEATCICYNPDTGGCDWS